MKKLYIYTKTAFIALLMVIVSQACDFGKYQDDPNKPSQGTPALLLPTLIANTFNNGNPTTWCFTGQQLFYTERVESDQYWGWTTTGLGGYGTIRQAVLMEEAAEKSGQPVYVALANLFKQLQFYYMTRDVGNIPYVEAMKAKEQLFKPKYDDQKTIFKNILKELESVNLILSNNKSVSIDGDILYNGDILKWQKLTNSYRLKILMELSIKEDDGDMNIKQEFNTIFSDPGKYPVFTSNTDMPRFKYYDQDGNRYPTYDRTTTYAKTKLTTTLVDWMKERTDPRIFTYAEPAWPSDSNTWTEAQKAAFRENINNYIGLDPGGVWGDESKKACSNLNWRYYESPTVEDYSRFTYAEFNFIIAEAAVRGWITADAETYFKKGIEASMKFFGITDAQITDYYTNASTAFVGTSDKNKAITQINMEKWVAYFMNSSYEAYYNNRRLKAEGIGPNNDGVPQFKMGPDFYRDQMPMRWLYPQNEYFSNADNVEEAVKSQFGKDTETLFDLMWILKK